MPLAVSPYFGIDRAEIGEQREAATRLFSYWEKLLKMALAVSPYFGIDRAEIGEQREAATRRKNLNSFFRNFRLTL